MSDPSMSRFVCWIRDYLQVLRAYGPRRTISLVRYVRRTYGKRV